MAGDGARKLVRELEATAAVTGPSQITGSADVFSGKKAPTSFKGSSADEPSKGKGEGSSTELYTCHPR